MLKRLAPLALSATLSAALAGCGSAAESRGASAAPSVQPAPDVQTTPQVQPARAAEEPGEYPKDITEAFAREGSLTLNGYEVSRRAKRVRRVYLPESKLRPELLDSTYAVLKRGGRVVAKFDDGDSGIEVATAFGAFPFLGGGARQLAVSLTVPRGGRHWVLDLSSARPRVVFDSGDYGVGREELSVIDIDKDGTYELSMPVTAFYMFEDMSMAETPLPEIVFKYDANARRYLPANRLFPGYALREVGRDVEALKPDDTTYMSERLDILLRYVYAGREREGWDFFDRAYARPDRDALKKKIASELAEEPVYKFLYRTAAKRRS
ncbi:MAG TPA: hypothetical protein VM936_02545 [Pyrinomonadaceae bacterium]|jgi:hypothetical protein|nr:hypothetical protein [Pyrinomonadaceae bacterium]